MKKPILTAAVLLLLAPASHAQILQKIMGKKKAAEEAPMPGATDPTLIIGGEDAVRIDSSYEFDWAVYQESEAFQGNQRVIDGGEDIVIYYSSTQAAFNIQLKSRSTGTKYYFFGDFQRNRS